MQAARDAYATREVLESDVLRDSISLADEEVLCGVVQASGLGAGIMPAPLSTDFEATVQEARERLGRLLMGSAIILSRDRG